MTQPGNRETVMAAEEVLLQRLKELKGLIKNCALSYKEAREQIARTEYQFLMDLGYGDVLKQLADAYMCAEGLDC